jgi:flavin reductase (DIM6/NTAB) family NADH-FMN oxidoreductase RutF
MLTFVPDDMPQREAYRLLMSSIVPRPIGWISSVSPDGTPNIAPYSFFNGVSGKPPVVMFSVSAKSPRFGGGIKDTLINVKATGEFVVNIVDETLAEAMNATAGEYPHGVSEFEQAGLAIAPSVDVHPPRVSTARIALEAKLHQIVEVKDSASVMVLGRIVRYHIHPDVFRADAGTVDAAALQPVARLGGAEYAVLGDVFSLQRPVITLPDQD